MVHHQHKEDQAQQLQEHQHQYQPLEVEQEQVDQTQMDLFFNLVDQEQEEHMPGQLELVQQVKDILEDQEPIQVDLSLKGVQVVEQELLEQQTQQEVQVKPQLLQDLV
jgi:hypothetical protein